jgi:hypothetical protein
MFVLRWQKLCWGVSKWPRSGRLRQKNAVVLLPFHSSEAYCGLGDAQDELTEPQLHLACMWSS